MIRAIVRSLGVDVGEARLVAGLALHSALIGSVLILTLTSANALFIATVGPQGLPYVYLLVAVAAPLSSFAFLRLGSRVAERRAAWITLVGITLVFLGLHVLVGGGSPLLAAFGLLVWYRVAEVLLNLEFWGLTASLLDLRQAKRLYGVIGSGEVLAMMGGGLALPLLVARVGSQGLVLLAAAATALCLPVVLGLLPPGSASLGGRVRLAGDGRRITAASRQHAPFMRLILGLFLTSVLMRYLVDKNFLAVAVERFRSADALAAFLGVFYAAAAAVTLLLRSLVTGPWLGRFGAGAGLLMLPLSLGLAALITVLLAGSNPSPLILFWPLAAGKFFDHAFRHSIDRSSVLLLFQPLPGPLRLRTQTLAEGVVSPLAAGSAGLLILAIDRFRSSAPPTLAWWMLAVVVVWIGVALALWHAYPRTLALVLRRRHWAGGAVSADDRASREVLRRAALDHASATEAVHALELLQESDPAFVATQLPTLLSNPNPEVRLRVLELVEQGRQPPPLPWFRGIADGESDPELRGAALRVLAAHDGEREQLRLAEHLSTGPDPVRVGALVGLLRHGSPESMAAAERALIHLRCSPEPSQRRLAARVLAQVGQRRLSGELAALLHDGDGTVRRAALQAAGPWVQSGIWDQVVERLQERQLRQPALLALRVAGDLAMGSLINRLQEGVPSPDEELCLLRLLASTDHPSGHAALLRRLPLSDPGARHAALLALAGAGYRPDAPAAAAPVTGAPAEEVGDLLEAELLRDVRLGAWLLRSLVDLGDRDVGLLIEGLGTGLHRCRERILVLLEFLHGEASIREARLRYGSGSLRERAMAIELLDSILSPSLQDMVLPLLEGQNSAGALARIPSKFQLPPLSSEGRLLDILEGRSYSLAYPWLRTCAFYSIDAAGRFSTRVVPNANAFTPMTDAATMEKILALKGVDIFSGTPSDVLLQLALAVEDVHLSAGEELFREGDLGTSMFVIAAGLVRVHKGDQTIVELGRREIVGELAALDPEPRSASVSAIDPSLLYRIDQETLAELMVDHPEIVQGVIRELAKRLRNTTAVYDGV